MNQTTGSFNVNEPAYIEAQKRATRTKKIFGGIVLFLGLGLVIASLVGVIMNYNYAKTLVTAKGTVTQVQTRRYSCGKNHHSICVDYIPTIQFTDTVGNQHTFTNAAISDVEISKVGNQVDVAYEPRNPSKAQYKSAFHQWAGGFFVTGFGLLISLFGLFILAGKAVPRVQYPNPPNM